MSVFGGHMDIGQRYCPFTDKFFLENSKEAQLLMLRIPWTSEKKIYNGMLFLHLSTWSSRYVFLRLIQTPEKLDKYQLSFSIISELHFSFLSVRQRRAEASILWSSADLCSNPESTGRDGSVEKVPGIQAWGLEFESRHSCKILDATAHIWNFRPGAAETSICLWTSLTG